MSEIKLGTFAPSFDRIGEFSPSSAGKEITKGGTGSTGATTGASFLETLQAQVSHVNESLQTADKASQDFAAGKAGSLHDVMIAMEKAEISLRSLTAVRGKVIEAYQEIMRMPV